MVGQGAGLGKRYSFVNGKLSGISRAYLLLSLLVDLIPNQDDHYIGVSLLSDWLYPPFHIFKCFDLGNIVDDQSPQCFTVMAGYKQIYAVVMERYCSWPARDITYVYPCPRFAFLFSSCYFPTPRSSYWIPLRSWVRYSCSKAECDHSFFICSSRLIYWTPALNSFSPRSCPPLKLLRAEWITFEQVVVTLPVFQILVHFKYKY